ncbi:MAG: hypothetical protein ABIS51_01935 [Sphingomonas sp.]
MLIPALPLQAQRARGADTDREILVMLRLGPPHYRPNSGYSGDYGDGASRTARRRIALGIAHRNRLELVDGWPMPLVGVDCYVMRVPADITIEIAVAQVSKDPSVVWSEQMGAFQAGGEVHSPAL